MFSIHMPACKECDLVFYSNEGLQLHVEKSHIKKDPNKLDSFTS